MLLDKIFFESLGAKLINAENAEITGAGYDSRAIEKGDVFFALSGKNVSGADYAREALKNGASAVAAAQEIENLSVAQIICENLPLLMAKLSRHVYGYPDEELTVTGITGTNGKTTVAYLLEEILKFNGISAGVIGTINYRYPGKVVAAPNTTPQSADIYRLMREMLNAGVKHVIMEVSSHALELLRVAEADFDIAVFTNLTQDHLDFHGTLENYFNAKQKLFSGLGRGSKKTKKYAIINSDDVWGQKLLKNAANAEVLTFGTRGAADYKAENISVTPGHTFFTLEHGGKKFDVSTKQIGLHNVYNALASAAAANACGVEIEKCITALTGSSGAPGRLERVDTCGLGFEIFVDYAHTEDALKNVLASLKRLKPKRIITVFGAGGDRDRSKRPLMGAAAASLSDFIFVTSDNPRTEDPYKIILDIEVGIKRIGENNYKVVSDRREAVKQAVFMAQKGDVILLAGKGHETYQITGTEKKYFNDAETAAEFVKEVKAASRPRQYQKEFNF